MKNKVLVLTLLPLSLLTLVGCKKKTKSLDDYRLSYGSLCDDEAQLLSQKEFKDKIDNKESFVIALIPGEEKTVTCTCWKTFSWVINNFCMSDERIIYKANVYHLTDYGVKAPTKEDPGLAIFIDGVLYQQFEYTVKDTKEYWHDVDSLRELISGYTSNPNMIYINDEQYKQYQSNDRFVVSIIRNSCGDCKYVLPNVFDPYFKKHSVEDKLYLLDIQSHHGEDTYQKYKDSINLSKENNPIYGYNDGVVPTTFVYEEGQIVDGSVFFNDKIVKEDDKYIVKETYYSNFRKDGLHYLTGVKTPILEGLELLEDEVVEYKGEYYWKSESSSKYHTPLLESFLKTYMK